MKIIIYLASRDTTAEDNYSALVAQRKSVVPSNTIYNAHLLLKDGRLTNDKKDLFQYIQAKEKKDVKVEFIAHGRPNDPLQFLCLPPGAPPQNKDDYVISPDKLALFFKDFASDQEGVLKFESLTLFCCRSQKFGEELSKIITNIEICCFHEDIHIDRLSGIALNTLGHVATKHYFKDGVKLVNPHNDNVKTDEDKKDALTQMINQNFAEFSLSSREQTLMLRGDPFKKYASNTYPIASHNVNSHLEVIIDNSTQPYIDDDNSNPDNHRNAGNDDELPRPKGP